MTGAEIMEQMDRMTMGWWRPSPGSIYPLLEQLEQDKLVEKGSDNRYRLTDRARSGPEWMHGRRFPGNAGPRDPADATGELESYVRYLEDVAAGDPAKLGPVRERIEGVARRLDRLASTGASSDHGGR